MSISLLFLKYRNQRETHQCSTGLTALNVPRQNLQIDNLYSNFQKAHNKWINKRRKNQKMKIHIKLSAKKE